MFALYHVHEFSERGSPCSGTEKWKSFMGYEASGHVIEE
jgi:hypothetical protein